jgi:ankyrin repeat protein
MSNRLVGLAVALLAVVPALAADPPAKKASTPAEIKKLIDELTKVKEPDMGYSPSVSGTAFLPLGQSQAGTILFGQKPSASADAMRRLVELGPAAVPHLLEHLTDARRTKLVIVRTGIGGLFVNADEEPAKWSGDSPGNWYTVKVADLCYVALGQIVNRDYPAVYYQPTGFTFVTAVARSKKVRDEVTREWQGLTADKHRESLGRDLLDDPSYQVRARAAVRLGYYYPDALEAVVVKQLAKPCYAPRRVRHVIADELYPAKTATDRKDRLDAFAARYGEVARRGVRDELFFDLSNQEREEKQGDQPTVRARECLIELFGQPPTVKSTDAPKPTALSGADQARIIETLIYDRTEKIDRAVRDLFVAADDEYLDAVCLRRLVGRGYDADIETFVKRKRDTGSDSERRLAEEYAAKLGWTRLHQAVDFGRVDLVERELKDRVPVDARAGDGRTALHWAAAEGKAAIVETLLAAKADLKIKDATGRLPVQLAAQYGRRDIVHLLVKRGSDIPDALVAVAAGKADRLAALVKADSAQLTLRNDKGLLPLHLAAADGQLQAVRALLDAGANVDDRDETRLPDGKVSSSGRTPLHLAVMAGKPAVARLLLDRGADVNAPDDVGKLTPLHHAARDGDADLIGVLLAHNADRKAKDSDGRTPLETARKHENKTAVRALEKP